MSRRLEPQDLYAIKLVEDPQLAPDGMRIAYVVAEIDRQSYEYHRSVWVTAVGPTQGHRYTAGDGQDAEVEDERITGTQSVRFAPYPEGGVGVALELRYQLKRAFPGSALVDAIFIRRAMRDSLARTLRRFAIELAAEREL